MRPENRQHVFNVIYSTSLIYSCLIWNLFHKTPEVSVLIFNMVCMFRSQLVTFLFIRPLPSTSAIYYSRFLRTERVFNYEERQHKFFSWTVKNWIITIINWRNLRYRRIKVYGLKKRWKWSIFVLIINLIYKLINLMVVSIFLSLFLTMFKRSFCSSTSHLANFDNRQKFDNYHNVRESEKT